VFPSRADNEAPSAGSSRVNPPNSLLREACNVNRDAIADHLSTVGFNNIPATWPLVLGAIASNGQAADADVRMLGITEEEASHAIDGLVRRGYLEFRSARGDRDGDKAAITERGHALLQAATHAVRQARWTDFTFRQGDIVVSTWPKTGTTWVQMICALLIFQIPDLPAPLSELSQWLDLTSISRAEVYARLDAQEHRRIIKTHMPLNEIPVDPRATYIAVGRHPLDAALSFYHSDNNDNMADGSNSVVPGPPEPGRRSQQPMSAREWLLQWIDMEPSPGRYHYLAMMLWQLLAAWTRRSGRAEARWPGYTGADGTDRGGRRAGPALGGTVGSVSRSALSVTCEPRLSP
jgi:aryl sulfotransferase